MLVAVLVAVLVGKTQRCAAVRDYAEADTHADPCIHAGPKRVTRFLARSRQTVHTCAGRDLKSLGTQVPCRFDSGPPHQSSLTATESSERRYSPCGGLIVPTLAAAFHSNLC